MFILSSLLIQQKRSKTLTIRASILVLVTHETKKQSIANFRATRWVQNFQFLLSTLPIRPKMY